LFAVGSYSPGGSVYYSLIYHYDGNQWSRINTGTDYPVQFYKIRSFPSGGKYLVLGTKGQQNSGELDTSKIYEFDGLHLKEIYSAPEGRHGYGDFTPVPKGMIIARGMNISLSDGTYEHFLFDVGNDQFGNALGSRTEKDIFLAMYDGIAHYNGSDITYLYRFTGTKVHIHGMKLFEKSVFVIAYDFNSNVNYIFRGYLK
jgi:hypothetical protein